MYAVHDILQIAPEAVIHDSLPAWAAESLAACPFVVVRRAHAQNGLVPVGIRGAQRHRREAAFVPHKAVCSHIPPALLADEARWHSGRLSTLPVAAALNKVAEAATHFGLVWGPVGSVGFELASGRPCVHAASDLDLAFYPPTPWPTAAAAQLLQLLQQLPLPADALLETPRGAVALAEYAAGGKTLLLRTQNGPRLVQDPWAGV